MPRILQLEGINSSSSIDLQTLNTSRLFIKNDGNVGIGSTNPQDELDLGSPTAGRGITWAGTNGASRYNSIFSSFSGAGLVFSVGFHGSVSADSYISSFTGTQGLAGIRIDSFGGVAGAIRFFTDAAASRTAGGAVVPTERLRITASGGISFGDTGTNFGTSSQVLISAGNLPPSWGLIANANVSASAAIAYSKLALTTSIVNNDISTGAAIVYSKLSLGSSIVNTDISASAAIADTKLGTISTALKVSNSATTATNANTALAIVARDASGNFSAGTITATLTGNVTGNTSGSSGSCTGNSATATLATTATTANALNTANNYQVNSLGIGTAASTTAGEIRATNNITAYYSDERLKNFIGKISNSLEKVNSLNGYYYKENSTAKELGYNNDSVQVGISAQEVEKILPEIVTLAPIDCSTDSEGKTISKTGQNYKTVYYEKLIPLLIEAIKELSSEIEKLKHK